MAVKNIYIFLKIQNFGKLLKALVKKNLQLWIMNKAIKVDFMDL